MKHIILASLLSFVIEVAVSEAACCEQICNTAKYQTTCLRLQPNAGCSAEEHGTCVCNWVAVGGDLHNVRCIAEIHSEDPPLKFSSTLVGIVLGVVISLACCSLLCWECLRARGEVVEVSEPALLLGSKRYFASPRSQQAPSECGTSTPKATPQPCPLFAPVYTADSDWLDPGAVGDPSVLHALTKTPSIKTRNGSVVSLTLSSTAGDLSPRTRRVTFAAPPPPARPAPAEIEDELLCERLEAEQPLRVMEPMWARVARAELAEAAERSALCRRSHRPEKHGEALAECVGKQRVASSPAEIRAIVKERAGGAGLGLGGDAGAMLDGTPLARLSGFVRRRCEDVHVEAPPGLVLAPLEAGMELPSINAAEEEEEMEDEGDHDHEEEEGGDSEGSESDDGHGHGQSEELPERVAVAADGTLWQRPGEGQLGRAWQVKVARGTGSSRPGLNLKQGSWDHNLEGKRGRQWAPISPARRLQLQSLLHS